MPFLVPPVIVTSQVDPPPSVVTPIPASDTSFTFNIPFRSDEQSLVANFILDFDPKNVTGIIQDQQDEASDPRPFAEQSGPTAANSRSVSWTWPSIPRPISGCHALTMILTRSDNGFYGTKDPLDAAQVTWFLDMLDVDGTSHKCGPTSSSGSSP